MPKLKVTIASICIAVILSMMSGSIMLTEASAQNIIGYSESKITVKSQQDEEENNDVCGSSKFQLAEAFAKEVKGNEIENATIGSQILLRASIISYCEISNYPLLVILGFQDAYGGNLIAYQNLTMNPGEQITIESSWTPNSTGDYEMIVFGHACLPCSGDFGIAERYDLTVIDQ